MSSSRPRALSSPDNPQFKLWDSLAEPRGIRKHGQFILAGRKAVPEALARWPKRFTAVLTEDGVVPEATPDEMPVYALSRPLFTQLDSFGTGAALLVGTVPDLAPIDVGVRPQGLELLCAVGDPGNLGALLRSAAAFGVARVVLLDGAAHPFHPRALRAAANAPFQVELRRGPGWADLATAAGPLVALDARGSAMADFPWPRDLRLVLGEEGLGVPAGLPVERLAIAMPGGVESLNATVAASIALYDWSQRSR
jgi:RNA methyltransferase, TrmH family